MEEDVDDNATLVNYGDRSQSRGREGYTSTGIGGLGNIRRTSLSREYRPDSGPDDFSNTRGRETAVDPSRVHSTGRGGAGNIRSPSQDASPLRANPSEREVIDSYKTTSKDAPHSTGRGGLGNFSRSRSRGPAVAAIPEDVHSTGRGGMGNIRPGHPIQAEILDDEERKRLGHQEGVHSTGRGGAANLTSAHEPAVEHHGHSTTEYASTGRGGSGNIVRDRSVDRA